MFCPFPIIGKRMLMLKSFADDNILRLRPVLFLMFPLPSQPPSAVESLLYVRPPIA